MAYELPALHVYAQAVEATFLRLRGAPLLLSPTDFTITERWHRRGVPLELVNEILAEVFASRAQRGVRGRVQSLRYVAPAVEAAWEEIEELQATGRREEAAPVLDVDARLRRLAAALPENLPDRHEWVKWIESVIGSDSPPERAEEFLGMLDRAILSMAWDDMTQEDSRELMARVESSLKVVAGRLPADELAGARDRLRHRLLRKHLGLPVLSLFSPEAEG